MHFLLFAMKRAYQRTLWKAAPLVHPFGLTPARYDVMFLLFTHDALVPCQPETMRITQTHLWKTLGVSRETVRRMLVGLEKLGFIERFPPTEKWEDRRTKIVRLTELGRRAVRHATKRLFPNGLFVGPLRCRREPLQRLFERLFSRNSVETLHSTLSRLALFVGDRASLAYPTFDPDD
jgi:DNA-binding MarR family transcriptional regulator